MEHLSMIDTLANTPPSMIEPMTEQDSVAFFGLFQMEEKIGSAKEIRDHFKEDASIFQLDVMLRRLEAAPPELQFCAQTVLMATQLAPNVGSIVMWAYTLVRETQLNGVVTMSVLADLFPDGFPTEEGYSRMWAQQKNYKGAGDNWLDTKDAWK
jgi:hypothetical protein